MTSRTPQAATGREGEHIELSRQSHLHELIIFRTSNGGLKAVGKGAEVVMRRRIALITLKNWLLTGCSYHQLLSTRDWLAKDGPAHAREELRTRCPRYLKMVARKQLVRRSWDTKTERVSSTSQNRHFYPDDSKIGRHQW